MTVPTRRIRGSRLRHPGLPRFDLRATAVFFTLLALLLIVLGVVARAAGAVAERRPVWTVVLCLLCAPALVAGVHGRYRRRSAARAAHRAATALQEATRTALDALEPPAGRECPSPAPTVAVVPADEPEPTVVVDYAALDADAFEQAVAALCERDGCGSVEVVGGAGDLGADVVGVDPQGRRLIVQCKRYGEDNRVGSQDLQRFGGTCFTVHEADVAAVVTTSGFTAPAVEYAAHCGIVCLDGEALRAWSEGTGPAPWELPAPAPGAGLPPQ
ncbi:restriction endonuclease [Streptomyces sp. NPDC003703]|uniref:restriction endonuclease n=1 Tax=Streptomyces sp. NPDC003283 TaxID=3364681 RepID=UPI00368FD61F